MADSVNLYNPHDGLTGRDGGPYADQEERRLAEIIRAQKEDREPDFDNAPATAGTPLVTAATLVNIANPASNPSQQGNDPYAYAVDTLAGEEDFPVEAFSSREKTEQETDQEEKEKNASVFDNPANPTVISKDEDADDKKPAAKTAAAKK